MPVPTMPHEYLKAPGADISLSYTAEPTAETYRFLSQYIAMRIESLEIAAQHRADAAAARDRHDAAEARVAAMGAGGES